MSLLMFWPTGAPAAMVVAASANIAASGSATTAQLTAPAGKTSAANFQAGRIQDDENPTDAIDLAADTYTELEWSLQAVSGVALPTEVYEFRVTLNGVPMDTYTVTPTWTIGTGAAQTFTRSIQLQQAVKRSSTY
jgi:hypothetical protein